MNVEFCTAIIETHMIDTKYVAILKVVNVKMHEVGRSRVPIIKKTTYSQTQVKKTCKI